MQWNRTATATRIAFVLSTAPMAVGASAAEIAIVSTGSLNFGSFVAGAGGAVTVSTSGARSAAGGVFLIPSSSSAAARFEVSGDGGAVYSIGLPGEVALDNGAGQTMTLRDFTSEPSGFGSLSIGGTQTVSVGATLDVSANQASGAYSGTFSVTVNYN